MIRAFILYFLNIKSTHGYEIQKYIQINQMDEWTKIQSGSIYYALGKLEKEGLIKVVREEVLNGKTRKIYGITNQGKTALEDTLLTEFTHPIYNIESDKFVSYPFFNQIERSKLEAQIQSHIKSLNLKKSKVEGWREIKSSHNSLGITKLSFEMMLSSIDYQIKWHEALLDELDRCIEESSHVSDLIQTVDFTEISKAEDLFKNEQVIDLQAIKSSILDNPDKAEAILSNLINQIKE